MDTTRHQQAGRLRRRAEHYRRLAQGAVDWPVAQEIETLAEECDEAAARLLAEAPQPSASAALARLRGAAPPMRRAR